MLKFINVLLRYCMSKKPCLFLYSELPLKNGKDFLDMRYIKAKLNRLIKLLLIFVVFFYYQIFLFLFDGLLKKDEKLLQKSSIFSEAGQREEEKISTIDVILVIRGFFRPLSLFCCDTKKFCEN